MNINDLFPSKYLKSDDLQGQRIKLTIMSVTVEDIADGEQKPVMRFVGKTKGMILNKTNGLSLAVAFGDDVLTWTGRDIELLAMPTHFNGKQVMGLVTLPMGLSTPAAASGGFGPDTTRSARGDAPSGPHDFKVPDDLRRAETNDQEQNSAIAAHAPGDAIDEIPF